MEKISEKYLLTIKEACAYSGIGEKRLRSIVKSNPELIRYNGEKILIHRRNFELYMDQNTNLY